MRLTARRPGARTSCAAAAASATVSCRSTWGCGGRVRASATPFACRARGRGRSPRRRARRREVPAAADGLDARAAGHAAAAPREPAGRRRGRRQRAHPDGGHARGGGAGTPPPFPRPPVRREPGAATRPRASQVQHAAQMLSEVLAACGSAPEAKSSELLGALVGSCRAAAAQLPALIESAVRRPCVRGCARVCSCVRARVWERLAGHAWYADVGAGPRRGVQMGAGSAGESLDLLFEANDALHGGPAAVPSAARVREGALTTATVRRRRRGGVRLLCNNWPAPGRRWRVRGGGGCCCCCGARGSSCCCGARDRAGPRGAARRSGATAAAAGPRFDLCPAYGVRCAGVAWLAGISRSRGRALGALGQCWLLRPRPRRPHWPRPRRPLPCRTAARTCWASLAVPRWWQRWRPLPPRVPRRRKRQRRWNLMTCSGGFTRAPVDARLLSACMRGRRVQRICVWACGGRRTRRIRRGCCRWQVRRRWRARERGGLLVLLPWRLCRRVGAPQAFHRASVRCAIRAPWCGPTSAAPQRLSEWSCRRQRRRRCVVGAR